MKLLDLTLPSPAANLACDEALLNRCENNDGEGVLRFWEPREYFVVVGYANKVATEVNAAVCEAHGIPILRRCSGGGTVLQGPGCLNYTLVLRITEDGPLRSIGPANRFIMERNRAALQGLLSGSSRRKEAPISKSEIRNPKSEITVRGHTDLAVGNLKFSGNSQRRSRRFLLFHGTFLLNFNLSLVSELLPMPSRQPDYREHRSHADFLTNLYLPADAMKHALQAAWKAETPLEVVPHDQIGSLVLDKYATEKWNWKF
jgi:lipoate-protein ligase A